MRLFDQLGALSLSTLTLLGLTIGGAKFCPPYFSSEIAVAEISEQQLAAQAKEITVIINGQNPGSGVIIGRENNTYYVLTAKHVVATADEYDIITSDGVEHSLNYNTVRKLPDVDLAVGQFSSDQIYPVATIGNSDRATEGATIYISGWPHPGQAITERIFQFTSGKISGRSLNSAQEGYELVYTNITRSGMSGGPVFNQNGELIAIHGRAEGEAIFNPDTGDNIDIKSGFNLGIPILYFFALSSPTDLVGNDTFVVPLVEWGDRFLAENDLSQAVAIYEKALRINPQIIPAMIHVGLIEYELGEIDSAIARWQRVAELQNDNAEVQMAIAVGLYINGEEEKGFSHAIRAIQLDPNIAESELLTKYLWGEKLLADAQPILDYAAQVVSVNGQELAGEFNIGQAQYEAGNLDRAKGLFKQVLELDDSQVHWYKVSATVALATVVYTQGDRDRGMKMIADFLRANARNLTSWDSRQRYLWSDRLKTDAEKLLAYFTPKISIRALGGSGNVAFSPDGRTIAGGSRLRLWDANTGEELQTFSQFNQPSSLVWSPDGKILAKDNGRLTIDFWNPKNGEKIGEIDTSDREKQTTNITALAFSPDGQILASGHRTDGNNLDCIILWDVNTRQVIRTFSGHPQVGAIAWSPDGQTLASGSQNNTIKLWDVNTGQERHQLIGHSGNITSVAFSPDGQTLASSSDDKSIKLWNVNTGQERQTLTGHRGKVFVVAFSPNGQTLASGSYDETIRFWDSRTGEELPDLFKADGIVKSLAFSPDGSSLVSSNYHLTAIEIWQVPQ